MLKVFFFITTHCIFISIFSQNINEAHRIVDTLTSSYFEGRGAVNKGEKKAAKFIVKDYEKLGLFPFEDSEQLRLTR